MIDRRSIWTRYFAWRATDHGKEVFGLFKRFAHEAHESGRREFGPNIIVERIRWYTNVETWTQDSEEFKVSDIFTSRMARELIAKEPAFEEFFNLRALRRL